LGEEEHFMTDYGDESSYRLPWDIFKEDIEIIKPIQTDDYSALDQIIGLCETEWTDASINHDKII